MSQIENAAREIVGCYYDGKRSCENDVAKIIRRHLFPVVKTEELKHNAFYWTLFDGIWTIEVGYEIQRSNPCDEIRGPVPMPSGDQ